MNRSGPNTVWWLNFASYALDLGPPRSAVGILLLFLSLFSTLWTFSEASGVGGSAKLVISLSSISFTVIAVLVIMARAFRWTMLFQAVKAYVRSHLIGKNINKHTILVSGGAGCAIAVGLVAKAAQELGHKVPKTLVVDCEYLGPRDPETCMLLPEGFKLDSDKRLIVHSYIGTGRSLKTLRHYLGLHNSPVFSFVVSNSILERERIDHYLLSGSRALVPWPRAVPPNEKG
jgi:hypothetical protein